MALLGGGVLHLMLRSLLNTCDNDMWHPWKPRVPASCQSTLGEPGVEAANVLEPECCLELWALRKSQNNCVTRRYMVSLPVDAAHLSAA